LDKRGYGEIRKDIEATATPTPYHLQKPLIKMRQLTSCYSDIKETPSTKRNALSILVIKN
jgi:hypothetical protein